MSTFTPPCTLFLAAGLLLAGAQQAQAQATFNIGPHLGGSLSTVKYESGAFFYKPKSRLGWEAGLEAVLQFKHFAIQASPVYRHMPFRLSDEGEQGGILFSAEQSFRLNYLSLPIQLAYTQHADGQGFQISAGGFIAPLLGGNFDISSSQTIAGNTTNGYVEGDVKVGAEAKRGSNAFYFKPLDVGVVVGVGYRYQNALLKLNYQVGLQDIGSKGVTSSASFPDAKYYTRNLIFSFNYFLSKK